MIPVYSILLDQFDIQSIENENYKMLLLNQLNYCNKNRDLILQRAESTYRKALSRKIPLYQKVCCNFEKLNVKARNMIQITFHLKRKFVQPYLPNNCSFQGAPRRVLLVL